MSDKRYYYAGAPFHPGTALPNNVTGECKHKHKTPEAAQACIGRLDAAMKRGNGQSAYCDRVVMVRAEDGSRSVWAKE